MSVGDRSGIVAGLYEHAAAESTGCLHVHDRTRTHSAHAYLDGGKVYAIHVDGFRPAIADRMLTAGLIDQVLHDQIIAAAGDDPRSPTIGALAVRRGMVAQDVLDAIHREIMLSALAAIASWPNSKARFRRLTSTTDYTVPAVTVAALTAAMDRRAAHWAAIWAEMNPGCPPHQAVPVRTDALTVAIDFSPDARTVLGRITGEHTIDHLAGACGLTRFETGHLLHTLHTAGLVRITNPALASGAAAVLPVPEPAASVTSAAVPRVPVAPPSPPSAAAPTVGPEASGGLPRRRPTPIAPEPVPVSTSATTPAPEPIDPDTVDFDTASAAFADATAAHDAATTAAHGTHADYTRMANVHSDTAHAALQCEQALAQALADEATAAERLASAQAELAKASERVGACRRAAAESRDRAAMAAQSTERARTRAQDAAQAKADAFARLDHVRAALTAAQRRAASADDQTGS